MGFLIVALFLLAIPAPANASEPSSSEVISPVHEEMLVNQALWLRNRMIGEGAIQKDAPFFIVDWTAGDRRMGARLQMAVEKKKAKIPSLQYAGCPPCDAPQGVIVFEIRGSDAVTSLMSDPARFLAQPGHFGFLMAIVPGRFQPSTLEPLLKETGLQMERVLAEPDIEFVQNQAGRQMIDLDDAGVLDAVFQRLVYQGINPVEAWPAVKRAVLTFRASTRKILILKKS